VSVPQTGERVWAAGPGERSVRVSLGHADSGTSTVSAPPYVHRSPQAAGPDRVRPGGPARAAPPVDVAPAHQVNALTTHGVSTGAVAAAVAMPLADVLALGTALACVTMSTGFPRAGVYAALAFATLVFAALSVSGLHRLRICLRVADQAGRIIAAAALPVVAVLPWLTAGQAFRLVAAAAVLLIAVRIAVSAALRAAHRRGRLTERVLLAGGGPEAEELASLLEEHPELGLRPAGGLGRCTGVSRVIVCAPGDSGSDLDSMLRAARARGADVCLATQLPGLGAAAPGGRLDEVWGVPLVPLRRSPWAAQAPLGRAVKRAFDVLAAAVLLAVTAPLVAVAALAVRLTLRRPALFRQVRVVGQGKLAEIVKLRTLGRHGDPDTSWSVPAGQCGALGRALRVTHIDELPQLVSVLRGDMSLVGPRPERPYFVRQFSQAVPGYTGRQRMPAGLTGWAQVHGLNGDTSISDRARFDNYYIEHWSFWLDLVVLGRTVTSIAAEAGRRSPITTHGGE
jgi:lipopolysaccharide/colanic/teichoic acid biosynthesis glycosyltransferase